MSLLTTIFNPYIVKATDTKIKVATIGSSSFYKGYTEDFGYLKLLQVKLQDTHIICCQSMTKSGAGTDFFLQQWISAVKGQGYKDLILYAGLNGLSTTAGMVSAKNDLDKIISEAKNEGLRIIVIGAQPFKGSSSWTQQFGDNIITNNDRLAKDPRVDIYIDVYSIVDKDNDQAIDSNLTDDHLHFNATGNQIVLNLVLQAAYSNTNSTQNNTNPNTIPSGNNYVVADTIFSEIKLEINKPDTKINIPGLNFSEPDIEKMKITDDLGNVWLAIPYLGEYIAAVYKYGIIIISLIAVINIIISGTMLIGSGGNSELVNQVKKRMMMSVVGLIVAVTSYSLLYLINPELVQFRNLRILYVKGQELEKVELTPTQYEALTGEKLPPMTNATKEGIIKKAGDLAEQAGLPRCLAETLAKFESGGNPAVIGHDENFPRATRTIPSRIKFLNTGLKYSGATFTPTPDSLSVALSKLNLLSGNAKTEYLKKIQISNIYNDDGGMYVDPIKLVPPDYGIDWKFSHGFGIGQITCGGGTKEQPDCRKDGNAGCLVGGVCYTVPELLTIEGGLKAKIARLKIFYQTNCWGVPGGTLNTPQKSIDLNIIKKTIANWGAGCTSEKTIPWADTRQKRLEFYQSCITN